MIQKGIVGLAFCIFTTSCTERSASTANVPAPQQAKVCRVSEGQDVRGGYVSPATITLSNDGGWCSFVLWTRDAGRVLGAPMHLTHAPAHGNVDIVVLENGTRISYRPTPGYVGSDTFGVINELLNIETPYAVTVQS